MLRTTCGTPPASPATENMFIRILTGALIAGAGAGALATALQLYFMQDLLVVAEAYESGTAQHFGAIVAPDVGGWTFDLRRYGLTLVFNALLFVGFALALMAVMALAERQGARLTARGGLIWGICGFVAVALAPAFGLPPELPGFAVSDIVSRQIWWTAAVVLTGGALWLVAFGNSWGAWGTAVLLALAPHLIGAPHPETFAGPTPPELAAEYAARSLGINFAAWALLGLLAATLWTEDTR